MLFKNIFNLHIISIFILLSACGDADKEANLVNLHIAASQDIVSINFPVEKNESIISINSEFNFTLQGVKSYNIDTINITNDVIWSLSENALSSIDQQGHLVASSTAELITLKAQFGHLTETFELKISDARFDEIIELDKDSFNIDMCLSKDIKPIARYIDKDGLDEIRPVDSNIINTIAWLIRNQEDNSASQRAYINTIANQASLQTLAAGNIIIQANALSVYTGTVKTSSDFNQSVNNAMNSIKICNSSDTDLNICNVTSANIEKDKSISFISVGNYQASDGSNFNKNITQNSKWGIDNTINASIAFGNDLQNLNITGKTESTSAILSVACGEITQPISSIDITKGVTLNSSVSCDANINCLDKSSNITIDKLSVSSFTVRANDIDLVDNTSQTLSSRPDEISLQVTANYTNSTSAVITIDDELIYNITLGDGSIIEDKLNSKGVYNVLGPGTAKIKLDYRTEEFTVLLEIP